MAFAPVPSGRRGDDRRAGMVLLNYTELNQQYGTESRHA